jgi:hypothetical protein
MGLTDFIVFLVAASLADRAYPPKPRRNEEHTMATQQAKLEHDRVLLEMSSPCMLRGDPTQVAEQAPKGHQQQQQQERPVIGQKRKAQGAPDAQAPTKRRASKNSITPSKPCEQTPLHDRLHQCLEIQYLNVNTAFDLNSGAQLVSMSLCLSAPDTRT